MGGAVRSGAAYVLRERYGVALSVAFFALAVLVFATSPNAWRPGSDGHYSYLYARSLAFDADIDFTNDYRLCGDPFQLGGDRGSGRPDNIFYMGPAIFWTPLLFSMRLAGVEGNGCDLPFTAVCLSLTLVIGTLAVFGSYRFVATLLSRGVGAVAVGLVVFGGPALLVTAATPSYSHAYDWFLAAVLCLLTTRIASAGGRVTDIALVSVALFALILQRASNVVFVLFPLATVLTSLRTEPAPRRALFASVLLMGAASGLAMTALVAAKLHGGAFEFSHGPYFLNIAHMHPILALFNKEAGVFFFWPVVWLALPGAVFGLREPALRLTAVLLGSIGVFELLLSSAALDWSPSRRLLNLVPVLALFVACVVERFRRWMSGNESRAFTVAATLGLIPLASWSCGYAWGASHGLVPLGPPLNQARLYGDSMTAFWTMIDENAGSLSTFPAEAWYSATRGMPRSTFGNAVAGRHYLRDFRTLRWISRRIDLKALHARGLTEGLRPAVGGMQLTGRARVTFATQWPHVTDIVLHVRSAAPARLKVGVRRFGGTAWLPERTVETGLVSFDVRALSLGSGLQEIAFEVGAGSPLLVLESLEFDDTEPREPIVQ
jgi:hypothetical protein